MARKRLYDQYRERLQQIADINHSIAVLSWDKEVNLPVKGASFRSQQVATLSGVGHRMFTEQEMGVLLNRLSKQRSLSLEERKNVKVSSEDYQMATLFTEEFVKQKSMAVSSAFHAWMEARKNNDFQLFEPSLSDLVNILRKESQILNRGKHPYDSHLHKYEPNLTVTVLDPIFEQIKSDLKPLLKKIKKRKQVNNSFLHQHFDKDKQWNFGLKVLRKMGYDFDKGRQDLSTHPFTISFNPNDVRVTTRVDEQDFSNMLWSCIHEGGHALYEQGLRTEAYGLPTGQAISLSIHESQSRLWENHVGRSLSYWVHWYPKLQKLFPEQFNGISLKKFYKGINQVSPNLIRTEADELHYHFHVIIRYEIEKLLIEGSITTKELPALWNEKYQSYLGIEPQDDESGILQDIHWSHGSFGYFPTYSLGSFYAAQFYQQAQKDIPKLSKKLEKGKTNHLLIWLKENIHQYGRFYEADELCEHLTGEKLNADHFMRYATDKFSRIYGIKNRSIS